MTAASVCAWERHHAGEALVEHRAERVDVGGGGRGLAADLLRGAVVDRPDELPARVRTVSPSPLVRPKSARNARSSLVDEDVLGLDVAVDQAGRVGGVEGGGDRGEDAQQPLGSSPPAIVRSLRVGPRTSRIAMNSASSHSPAS